MATSAELGILISARDQASKTLNEVQRAMRDVGKVGASVSKDVDGLIGTLGKIGLAGVGVHVITEGLGRLKDAFAGPIAAASDMAETQSKAAIVFGQSSDVVQKFAADAVSGLGLTKQATIEAAATFGNLLLSTGASRAESAKMSTTLVQLAADLASFNNVSGGSAQVLEDLRSGVVGEAEPLRKYGILLTEASVAQEAVRLKLAASTDAVSEQAKVQARYSLILQQTTTAQGDFARTSDGLANSTRIVQAAFGDFAGQLGGLFLPAIQPVMAALGKELPRVLPALVEALRPVGDAFASVGRQIADFITTGGLQRFVEQLKGQIDFALQALGILAQGFGSAFDSILRIVLSVGTLILEAFGLINPFVRHSPSLVESVEMGFARIGETIGALPGQVVPAIQAAGAAMASLGEAARGGLAQAAALARAEQEKLIALLGGAAVAAYQQAQAALAGYEAAMVAVKDQMTAAQADLDGLNQALKDQERALSENERALKRAQDAYAETGRKVSDLQGQIDDANRAIAGLGSTALPGENAASQKIFGLENALNILELERARLIQAGASKDDPRVKALDEEIRRHKEALEIARLEQKVKFDGARNEIEQARKAADYRETEKNTILKGIAEQIAKRAELQKQLEQATFAEILARSQVEQATAAVDEQKQKVEAARDAVEQQRNRLDELQKIYADLNTQAGAWRDQMQETEKAARSIEAALKAAEAAAKKAGAALPTRAGLDLPKLPGAGTGADTGPSAANQLVGPGALAAPMSEMERQLAALRSLRDSALDALKGLADNLSGIAGTGKDAADALKGLGDAYNTNVKPLIDFLNGTPLEKPTPASKAIDDLKQKLDGLKAWWDTDGKSMRDQMKDFLIKELPESEVPSEKALNESGLKGVLKKLKDWWDGDGATWRENIKTFFTSDFGNHIAAAAGALAGTDTTDFKGSWQDVVNWWDTTGKDWRAAIKDFLIQELPADATTGADALSKKGFLGAWNDLKAWWDGDGKAWRDDIGTWFTTTLDNLVTTGNGFVASFGQAWTDAQGAVQGLLDFFGGVFDAGIKALMAADGPLGRLKAWWDGFWELLQKISRLWSTLLGRKLPDVPADTGGGGGGGSAGYASQTNNITIDARGVDADRLARALPSTLATLTRTRGLSGAL